MTATCLAIEELFVSGGDAALQDDAPAQAHIHTCHPCRAALAALEEIDAMLPQLAHPSLESHNPEPDDAAWYVVLGDIQHGPLTMEALQQLADGGEIAADTPAWCAGMEDWRPLAEIVALATIAADLGPSPAPIAPPLARLNGSAYAAKPTGGSASLEDPKGWQPCAALSLASLTADALLPKEAPERAAAGVHPPAALAGIPELFPIASHPAAAAGPWQLPTVPKHRRRWALPWLVGTTGVLSSSVAAALMLAVVYRGEAPPRSILVQTPAAPPVVDVPPPNLQPTPSPTPPQRELVGTPEPHRPERVAADRNRASHRTRRPARDHSGDKRGAPRSKLGAPLAAQARQEVLPMLSVSDIVAGVKRNAASVMPCIKRARAAGELPPGRHKLILAWQIQPDGSVRGGKLTGPASVMGTSLPACLANAMRTWRFPPSTKGAPVRNFPFGPFTVN